MINLITLYIEPGDGMRYRVAFEPLNKDTSYVVRNKLDATQLATLKPTFFAFGEGDRAMTANCFYGEPDFPYAAEKLDLHPHVRRPSSNVMGYLCLLAVLDLPLPTPEQIDLMTGYTMSDWIGNLRPEWDKELRLTVRVLRQLLYSSDVTPETTTLPLPPRAVAHVTMLPGKKRGTDEHGQSWSRFTSDRPMPCAESRCAKWIRSGWYCEDTKCAYCDAHVTSAHGEGADGYYGSFEEAYTAWTSGKGCREGLEEHHCTCHYYFPCSTCTATIRATGDAMPSHKMHAGVCADCYTDKLLQG